MFVSAVFCAFKDVLTVCNSSPYLVPCEAWLVYRALGPTVQCEVCSLGAIPALVKLLREEGSRGQTAAAWALQVLAAATMTSR